MERGWAGFEMVRWTLRGSGSGRVWWLETLDYDHLVLGDQHLQGCELLVWAGMSVPSHSHRASLEKESPPP